MKTRDDILAEIERLGAIVPWYHAFELPDGISIGGWEGIRGIWANVRAVRSAIPYAGKRVLDLGSRDGMWSFEAEALGASTVIATDIGCDGYREHILFIKSLLRSRIAVYYNVPAEEAFQRLDCFFKFNPGEFDIVQHLGLLYHIEDPMRSLREARKCLKPTGALLLETAYCIGEHVAPMAMFNSGSDIYHDATTFWAMDLAALRGMLGLCGFSVDQSSIKTMYQNGRIGRVCLLAYPK